MEEMTLSEVECVSGAGRLDGVTGGLAIVGMSLIPGINVGLAVGAFTIGMGLMLSDVYYSGSGAGGGAYISNVRVQ